ncbi:MAG TPA: transketolase C-terminal domain-containing protein [Candidatus Lokiarchaeia archaeon]|nr:transketolase C-terminal domain-containing protein [Candidatus Lokiarchaeia archaeon]
MRDEMGAVLVEQGNIDSTLVVLDADLSTSTRTSLFREAFPGRFFNIGIAEQNMVGIATGLALAGKNVVVSGFSVFTLCRAWDFIRLAAHEQLPVKICTTHSGLSAGRDGSSHQTFEDLSLACSIPNLNVVAPADAGEARQIMEYVLQTPAPFFVRLTRNPTPPVIPSDYQYNFGVIQELSGGTEATLFAVGGMVEVALDASKCLAEEGINIQVMNASTIKPLDSRTIIKCASTTGAICVLEEHNILTGLGVQISAVVGKEYPVPIEIIGIPDQFGQSGEEQELREYYGLTAKDVAERLKHLIYRRK